MQSNDVKNYNPSEFQTHQSSPVRKRNPLREYATTNKSKRYYFGKELILSNLIDPIITKDVKMAPLFFSGGGTLFAFVGYDRG